MPETISLLGSTGSIGTQVLDVVRHFPNRFNVAALAAGRNIALLAAQIAEFRPDVVSIQDQAAIPELRAHLASLAPDFKGDILVGCDGLKTLATLSDVKTVIVGLVGLIGLAPSLAALEAGKKLLTANKETFVAGGHLVQPYLKQPNRIIPIDSEHSAVFQCLEGRPAETIEKIYLTASGGPFRLTPLTEFESITPKAALKHPNWVMGARISIDSATMMNKGLEVIEAHWLFDMPYEKISIVVHPESIIHGAIETKDGSIIAQMGATDMHGPIQYAMTYPECIANPEPATRLNLTDLSQLTLQAPDFKKFPCLSLAYEAGKLGSGATAVLNSADEELVSAFLREDIRFVDIPRLLEKCLDAYRDQFTSAAPALDEILALDAWTRDYVRQSFSLTLV